MLDNFFDAKKSMSTSPIVFNKKLFRVFIWKDDIHCPSFFVSFFRRNVNITKDFTFRHITHQCLRKNPSCYFKLLRELQNRK